jgi:UDP-2,4-diacetamido-2,4,6-trideoxy-beta-L-altropyranose hydrolase
LSQGTLLIRADAGFEIGTGHVMRCLALAQAWQDQGGKVTFAIAKGTSAIEERLRTEHCSIEIINKEIGSRDDATRTTEIGHACAAGWMVLDGYCFDSAYQRGIKHAGFKLLCVDDVGGRETYFADIVLNQNIHAHQTMYARRQNYTRCLLGTRFALLRREFRSTRLREPRHGARPRVLVTMGGSDPENIAGWVLQAIGEIRQLLEIIVVVGPANSSCDALRQNLPRAHKVQVVQNPDSMAELMSWADFAVSAAGSTVWEMCRLGLPAILISVADNQILGAKELDRRAIAAYLGRADNIQSSDIARNLADLLACPARAAEMSQLGQELVDGIGAERVVTSLRTIPLIIRRARQEDCWLLWQWANDPQVRAASFHSEAISREDHAAWFASRLNGADAAIYIAEDSGGVPIGQFRVERDGSGNAVVDVSVTPDRRRKGIGAALIVEAAQRIFRDTQLQRIYAHIKPENRASLCAFKNAGFSNFRRNGDSIHCSMEREQHGA